MRAYYDLSCCPPSFDVVSFLMWVEQQRIARGEDEIEIDILPGPVGGFRHDTLWPYGIPARVGLRDKVAVPMCRMLPSVRRVTVRDDRPSAVSGSIGHGIYAMHFRQFVAAMAEGIRPLVPRTQIPIDAQRITITLRESEHWSERNSNVAEWIEAAGRMARRGFNVVFVRDTRFAGEEIPGHSIDPAAALDLDYRGAMYRASGCNLFVSNGPAWFSMACDAPTIIVKPANEALGRCYGSEWFRSCGVPVGGQMAGAPGYQRLVWADDTADVIEAAVVEHFRAFAVAA